jgi:CO/xanthine dehydrogenase FAD-binding subunit
LAGVAIRPVRARSSNVSLLGRVLQKHECSFSAAVRACQEAMRPDVNMSSIYRIRCVKPAGASYELREFGV